MTPVVLALLAAVVQIENNHPFPIRVPVQAEGAAFVAEVPASSRKTVSVSPDASSDLEAKPDQGGLRLRYRGTDLGRLTWDVIVRQAKTGVDHAKEFRPLGLKWERAAGGWKGNGERDGFTVEVIATVYGAGFLDTTVTLRNVSANTIYGMYAAGVARWEHPQLIARTVCYDNRIDTLEAEGSTRFRAGEGRHWSLQHGVDWIRLGFPEASALVLNNYSELFTALDESKSRFVGANLPQVGNEAVSRYPVLYLITEIARDNHPYRDRFIENLLPARGVPVSYENRIVFEPAPISRAPISRERADQHFLAYTSYISRHDQVIQFGVRGVLFGTSYFPYSTLGENFDSLKLPGQATDAFWPLSADTVTHWRDFADDIRRDLRIAKAMGFGVIRLHYLDLIAKLPERLQYEYLDFIFGELRHLKLRAMMSTAFTYWTPEQIAARVARYKDVVDRLELENEILIWGLPLDRPQYWSRIYSEVKRVAPNVQIHWTSHLNTGIFNRMDNFHLKYDAVSAHCYVDSLDAIPSARGFALAVGNYAARAGKPAIYTEWNWRGLTRMTEEARAEVYPPIMENLLATRAISELYQFQFNETLCVNPRTRKGIRHYEPLWLSRRPKAEAFQLMRLIDQYSPSDAPNHLIGIEHVVAGSGAAAFHVVNNSGRTLRLRASLETPPGITAKLGRSPEFQLAPGVSTDVPLSISITAGALPGFYHVFLRLEAPGGLVRYGWAEVRHPGQPKLVPALGFDFNRPIAVIYGDGAPVIELETAYSLANTLESATGRPVKLYQLPDRAPDGTALLVVGTATSNSLVASALSRKDCLVVTGQTSKDVETAGMKLLLSYWKFAKDSAARRAGLVEKELPAGADVANLP